MMEMGLSMGPDALRAPAGPLPADPADDANLPEELKAVKAEAERRLGEWAATGRGLVSSSLYDAGAWFPPVVVTTTPTTPSSRCLRPTPHRAVRPGRQDLRVQLGSCLSVITAQRPKVAFGPGHL